MAYLVSEYPALSHTFISNEIRELEKRGHEVLPVSVRRPRNPKATEGEMRREAERTCYLLEETKRSFLPVLARTLLRSPRDLFGMAREAIVVFRGKKKPITVLAYFAEAVVLVDRLRREGISHIHNHFGNAAGAVALIAGESRSIDYSLSVHGPDIFYEVEAESLARKVEKARFTRCISHFCRSQLCLLTDPAHWTRLHIVRCGVDTARFNPRDPDAPSPRAVPELLCVGRLVPAKGQHVLLEAASVVSARGLDFHLTFVGTGPDEERLRCTCSRLGLDDRVTFTGGLPPEQVRSHFENADLFILPSFAEGIPVVLMEAMACGVPVISSPINGIPELIEHQRNGILTPPGCVESLANAIGDFLVCPDSWSSMARLGRTKVEKEYDQSTNGHAMTHLFESQLG